MPEPADSKSPSIRADTCHVRGSTPVIPFSTGSKEEARSFVNDVYRMFAEQNMDIDSTAGKLVFSRLLTGQALRWYNMLAYATMTTLS